MNSPVEPSAEAEVAIVGQGPVGATLANLLGARGISVIAVDKDRLVHDKPRAITLDHEAMRTFQNVGLSEQIAPHIVPFLRSVYLGLEGRVIKQLVTKPAPFALGWCPNYLFSQPAVDQILRDGAAARADVRVWLGSEAVGTAEEADRVRLDVSGDDGSTRQIFATYVVACDGGSSPMRRRLGIGFDDLEFDEPWLVVDALVDAAHLPALPQTNVQYCEPERPCTHVIGPGNHRRWEIMMLPGEDPLEMQSEANIWRLLARWITPANARLWRATSYRFHALVAREWQRGRILLAGDAAHMTPPFLGQGMCQGFRDAANLAWKLEMVLRRGGSAERLFASYGEERAPHVRATTEVAKGLGRIICELDPAKAAARDAAMLAGGDGREEIRQNLIPGLVGGVLSRQAGPATGSIFPQPKVRSGQGETLLDNLTGNGFRLVARDAGVLPSADDRRVTAFGMTLAALGLSKADGVLLIDECNGALAQWFNEHDCSAALVRPDHYVFGTARTKAETAALLDELHEMTFAERRVQ